MNDRQLWVFASHGVPLICGTLYIDGNEGTLYASEALRNSITAEMSFVCCLPSKNFDTRLVTGVAVIAGTRSLPSVNYVTFREDEPVNLKFRVYTFPETLWHKLYKWYYSWKNWKKPQFPYLSSLVSGGRIDSRRGCRCETLDSEL